LLKILSPSTALWKQVLRTNFFDSAKLANYLELSEEQRKLIATNSRFPLNLPLRLAQKVEKGNLDDPILKQFLPVTNEYETSKDFLPDPVGDNLCRKEAKLLQKYHGRVLLLCTSACAMNCRFCFRQHFDYDVKDKSFDEELAFIAADDTINEVILSGGDPLSLDDRILSHLLQGIAEIPHVHKVRFHTRFPIGIPERIDASFLSMLREVPFQVWFVIQSNHARELDQDILNALKSIQKLGIPVLNHTVLLRGVNDDVDVLAALFERLVDHGIFPYYLNHLDRVQGAAHFDVPEAEGISLIEKLSARLPGYAVPKYIKEIPGAAGKTRII
jgi:EF-P beta-lysylation protein EpmB